MPIYPIELVQRIVSYLAIHKQLKIFRISPDFYSDITVWEQAAKNGDLPVIQYLVKSGFDGQYLGDTLEVAALYGHLDVVRWIVDNMHQQPCTRGAMDNASEKGYLDIVEYLMDHRSHCYDPFTVSIAKENGHKNVAKFLQERLDGCASQQCGKCQRDC